MGRVLFIKGKSGNPHGRPKGARNKVTRDVREWARGLLEDPAYHAALQQRLIDGTCPPQLEVLLFYYAYGKPKSMADMEKAEQVHDYAQELLEFQQRIGKLLGFPASAEPEPEPATAPCGAEAARRASA